MIAQPTTAQVLDAVRLDLETRVAPAVADAAARRTLDMAILVLRSAAARSTHELEWMVEEADAVEALARDLVDRLPDSRDLQEALAECERSGRAVTEVHARYACAGELLSRAAEAAYDAGDGGAQRDVFAALDRRRRNQNAITGGFEAVGRS